MANIKSAKKRIITNEKKRVANTDLESSLKTAIKKINKCIESKNKKDAQESFNNVNKKIDKALKANIIKSNKRDKLKSKLAKKINELK